MSNPSDFQVLRAFLDAANRAKHLVSVGYRPCKGHYLSPHTGELVSEEQAIECERKLQEMKP